MKSGILVLIAVAAVLAGIVAYSSVFVVEEGKQAVVTRFNRPVNYVTDAGLHWKRPFVEEVHLLEKRALPWDGQPENIQIGDQMRIVIDAWARWKIVDLETYYSRVVPRTEQQGQQRLNARMNSAIRNVVASDKNKLIDVVRSTGEELEYETQEVEEVVLSRAAARERVTTGRGVIERMIREEASKGLVEDFGIELLEVRIKRVNYDEGVKKNVYQRMQAERERIAKLFESEGEGERNRILGRMQRELDNIEGEMQQQVAQIRGQADAEVIQLTAEAYGQSPEFYQFLRRLEVFKKSLDNNTRLVLSTNSDLLRLLKQVDTPQRPQAATEADVARQPPAAAVEAEGGDEGE